MGRTADVCIVNESNQKLEIAYKDVSCMYRSGEDGSSFNSISGLLNENGNCLPSNGTQRLVKEVGGPFNKCVTNNGFFTMIMWIIGKELNALFSGLLGTGK